ncbi:MAG: hypothetical protein ACXAES_03670 [Promethearchaeota archaeon]
MGKGFGLVSLLLGLVSIVVFILALFVFAIPFWDYIVWTLSIGAIVLGIIGMIKDDSKGLGVVGLILGIIGVILMILLPILFIGWLFSLLP